MRAMLHLAQEPDGTRGAASKNVEVRDVPMLWGSGVALRLNNTSNEFVGGWYSAGGAAEADASASFAGSGRLGLGENSSAVSRVLDRSDAWTPPSEYMAASATQAFRFINSDSAFSEREAHLLIRAFQEPHTTVEQRRAWCVEHMGTPRCCCCELAVWLRRRQLRSTHRLHLPSHPSPLPHPSR